MSRPFVLTEDPLSRFSDLWEALLANRRWTDDISALRYAALTLVTTEGEPRDISERIFESADELKAGAGWFGALNSSIRYLVAALLLRSDATAVELERAVERLSAGLKERGMRRTPTYDLLTALILVHGDPDEEVDEALLDRVAEIHAMMKKHHGWLTSVDDYPACALLAQRDDEVAVMEERIEAIYEGLRAKKYDRGNKLQTASHVLYVNPSRTGDIVERFDALYRAFKDRGLWMHQGDYDEMAILTFLEHGTEQIVDTVLAHREHIETLSKKPSKDVGFSIASSTAFLHLVRLDGELQAITDMTALSSVQAILAAQTSAAIMAANTAAISASTAT